ncbi:MAG: acyltransferase [Terrimicrobiaceae bacterium]
MKYPLSISIVFLADRIVHLVSRTWSTLKMRTMLRIHGAQAGSRLLVDGPVILRSQKWAGIRLGDRCTIYARPAVNLVGLTGPAVFHCWRTGEITVGNDVGMSSPVISSRSSIVIGDRVKLGGNVRIYDHDFHSLDHVLRQDPDCDQANILSAPVVLESDVFVGVNAMILKGVHIGARSIIGAGAVVALKSVPPDSVVAGSPARIIRTGYESARKPHDDGVR